MVIVKDLVCGMEFVKEDAAGTVVYNTKTYYFCAHTCIKLFESDPEKYIAMINDSYSLNKEIHKDGGEQDEKDNSLRKHD